MTPASRSLRASDGPDLAERNADFHAELADFADGLEDLLEFRGAVADALPRRAHAKAGGALRAGAVRSGEDVVERQETFALEAGGVVGALGAVAAVFATAAGLDAEEAATLDFRAAPMLQMDGAALRDEIEERLLIEGAESGQLHQRRTFNTLS